MRARSHTELLNHYNQLWINRCASLNAMAHGMSDHAPKAAHQLEQLADFWMKDCLSLDKEINREPPFDDPA